MVWRKMKSFSLVVLLSYMGTYNSVVMPPEEEFPEDVNSGFSYAFEHCIRSEGGHSIGSVLPCVNKGALASLVVADERESVEFVDGVSLIRDVNDKTPRTTVPVDMDTSSYRTLLETVSDFIGRRSLQWDMGVIHPGLFLKVGPMLNGAGVLEFVLERGYPTFNDRTVGPGRLIVRQILLPLLLGIKFKLITLLPLLIGVLVIISKKALLLSKIAVFVTSALGATTLFSLQQQHHTSSSVLPIQNGFGGSFLNLDTETLAYQNKEQHRQPFNDKHHHHNSFRGHRNFDETREPIYRVRDRFSEETEPRGGRNFVWEDSQRSKEDSPQETT